MIADINKPIRKSNAKVKSLEAVKQSGNADVDQYDMNRELLWIHYYHQWSLDVTRNILHKLSKFVGIEDVIPKPHAQDEETQSELDKEPIQNVETTLTEIVSPTPVSTFKKVGKSKIKKNPK